MEELLGLAFILDIVEHSSWFCSSVAAGVTQSTGVLLVHSWVILGKGSCLGCEGASFLFQRIVQELQNLMLSLTISQ